MVALIAAIGLLGVGLIFSSSFSAARVAGQARSLHWANATLGTVGIARAAVAQAVFFSYDSGMGDSDSQEVAIAEVERDLRAVETMLASPETPESLRGPVRDFIDTATSVVDLAESGDAPSAELARVTQLESSFQALSAQLTERQSELADAIAESEASAGQIARFTQLATTLFLPASAMIVFWLALRRRMRRDEEAMRARVEEEKRINQEKDEFIAGLSHELRTPLTAIYGFSELLLGDESLDQGASELVGLINAGSADLSRMVDDLLAAARLDAEALTSRPQRVDLAEQAELVAAPYRRTGEDIEVEVPSIEVYADPVHVRQVIHNLVSNARRHGGDKIVISASEKDNRAELVVSDDGEGVAPDAEDRLFQRFSNRGRDALVAGSVGLGLAISQELAMRMGGTIRYDRVDGWTSFALRLPVLPKAERVPRMTLIPADAGDS